MLGGGGTPFDPGCVKVGSSQLSPQDFVAEVMVVGDRELRTTVSEQGN